MKLRTSLFLFLISLLFSNSQAFAIDCKKKDDGQQVVQIKPEGWSFDVGGAYTWMDLTTPPTYSGSTGGVLAKLSYQKPNEFYGYVRSNFNIGPLSSSVNDTGEMEWYSEFVGGYCFSIFRNSNWTITPYGGLGLEFLYDDQSGYSSISPINLRYNTYYALTGFDTRYLWRNWLFGLQGDYLLIFNQYLRIEGLPRSAWILSNRMGAAVRLPLAYRYAKNFWLEWTPYFRFFPIGNISTLSLPERNLQEWGIFVTFRFFL